MSTCPPLEIANSNLTLPGGGMENKVYFGRCSGLATVAKQLNGPSDFSVACTSLGTWSPPNVICQGMLFGSCEINF